MTAKRTRVDYFGGPPSEDDETIDGFRFQVKCKRCGERLKITNQGRVVAGGEQQVILRCSNCLWSWQLYVSLTTVPRDNRQRARRPEEMMA